MQINGLTPPTSVWSAATRTLTNPSGVWLDATRTLTANPVTRTIFNGRPTIGAGSFLDLRPTVGLIRRVSFLHINNPANTDSPMIYDGANSDSGVSDAVEHLFSGYGTATQGTGIKNTGAAGSNWSYTGWDETL
jgi:hypothetical protein